MNEEAEETGATDTSCPVNAEQASAAELKKATIRFPLALHRFYRHQAVDTNMTFDAFVVRVLTRWALQHGFDPNASAGFSPTSFSSLSEE